MSKKSIVVLIYHCRELLDLKINAVYIPPPYFSKIHLNIILLPLSSSSPFRLSAPQLYTDAVTTEMSRIECNVETAPRCHLQNWFLDSYKPRIIAQT
jgi:hypothetical protein